MVPGNVDYYPLIPPIPPVLRKGAMHKGYGSYGEHIDKIMPTD